MYWISGILGCLLVAVVLIFGVTGTSIKLDVGALSHSGANAVIDMVNRTHLAGREAVTPTPSRPMTKASADITNPYSSDLTVDVKDSGTFIIKPGETRTIEGFTTTTEILGRECLQVTLSVQNIPSSTIRIFDGGTIEVVDP